MSVVPSIVPLLVLVLALAGQIKEPLATMALVGAGLVVVWGLGLVAAIAIQLVRRAPYASLVTGLVFSGLACAAALALVLDAPLWVRWRAEPAILAIERSRADSGHYPTSNSLDGDFPTSVRATLDASGHCLYKPRGASYHLACLGVPFARCGYDAANQRWSGWE